MVAGQVPSLQAGSAGNDSPFSMTPRQCGQQQKVLKLNSLRQEGDLGDLGVMGGKAWYTSSYEVAVQQVLVQPG